MPDMFLNPELQKKFDQDGFVVIPDFLGASLCRDLESLYLKRRPAGLSGFHVTNWLSNREYSMLSHEAVCDALLPEAKKWLAKPVPVLGCFAAKEPGGDNAMGPHQDWSITDEEHYTSVSLWVPLCDINEATGTLNFLKGSHRLFHNIRGQNIANPIDRLNQELVARLLTQLELRMGDAVVLHHRILHCSGPNMSSFPRVAAMLALLPQGAPLLHYYRNPEYRGEEIRRFVFPEGHYVTFDIRIFPEGCEELEPVLQTHEQISDDELLSFYS